MQNYSGLPPADCGKIQLLEFNDVQKAAMAAALMAVAEEVSNEPKTSVLRSGDFIDLLSSSEEEDNSDCEIYGVLMQDTGEEFQDVRQVVPIEMKFDVKTEIEEQIVPNTLEQQQPQQDGPSDDISNIETGQLQPNAVESEFNENQDVTNDNCDIGAEEQVSTYEPTAEQASSNNYHFDHEPFKEKIEVLTENKEKYAITNMRLLNREVVITNITKITPTVLGENALATILTDEDTTQSASEYSEISDEVNEANNSKRVRRANHQQNVANTFGTDQFDNDSDDVVNDAADTNIEAEADDVDNDGDEEISNDTGQIINDVIELDSDTDEDYYEDMDEETEKKLVELIESDCEESNACAATTTEEAPKTMDMLMHYICPECNQACGTLKKWKAHLDTDHGYSSIDKLNMQTIINKEGELCNQCKQCFHKFSYKTTYDRFLKHRITHLPFADFIKCRLCEMRCNHRLKLKVHLKRDHTKICKHYLNTNRDLLGRHVEFFCPVCNAHLKSQSSWNKHIEQKHAFFNDLEEKYNHIKDDIVECIECEKRFRRRQCKSHLLSHHKHKSFRCKICKKFLAITMAHCTDHVRVHHYQGGKRIYHCKYCDAQFERIKERTLHLRDKHHYRRVQCHQCKKKFASAAFLLSHMNFTNHQKLK